MKKAIEKASCLLSEVDIAGSPSVAAAATVVALFVRSSWSSPISRTARVSNVRLSPRLQGEEYIAKELARLEKMAAKPMSGGCCRLLVGLLGFKAMAGKAACCAAMVPEKQCASLCRLSSAPPAACATHHCPAYSVPSVSSSLPVPLCVQPPSWTRSAARSRCCRASWSRLGPPRRPPRRRRRRRGSTRRCEATQDVVLIQGAQDVVCCLRPPSTGGEEGRRSRGGAAQSVGRRATYARCLSCVSSPDTGGQCFVSTRCSTPA